MTSICGLAIEASSDLFSMAACRHGRTQYREARPAREETQRVFQVAEELLAPMGAGFGDLQFVAFSCGPGSFTGVRVAAAAAQSIAFACSIPVCRASSLSVLAMGAARTSSADLIATCVDARMGRAYAGLYRAADNGAMTVVQPDELVDPETFLFTGSETFAAVGDAWRVYPQAQVQHAMRIRELMPDLLPSALDLLSMAIQDFGAGRTLRAAEAVPEYLGQGPPRP